MVVEDETGDDLSRKGSSRRSKLMEQRSQSVRNFGSSSGSGTRRTRTTGKSQSSRSLGGLENSKKSISNTRKLNHHHNRHRSGSSKSVSSKHSRKSARSSSHRKLETGNQKSSRSSRTLLEDTDGGHKSRRKLDEKKSSQSQETALIRQSIKRMLEDTSKDERRVDMESIDSFKSFDLEIDLNEDMLMSIEIHSVGSNGEETELGFGSSSSIKDSGNSPGRSRRSNRESGNKSVRSHRSSSRRVSSRDGRILIPRQPSIDSIDEDTVLQDDIILDDADLESLLNIQTKIKKIPILDNSKGNTMHTQRTAASSSVHSQRSAAEERMETDAAFLLYSRTEKAALQIQQAFRNRHPEFKDPDGKPSSNDDNTGGPSESSSDYIYEENQERREKDNSIFYNTVFFGMFTLLYWGFAVCGACYKWFNRCCGSGTNGVDEVAAAAKFTVDGGAEAGGVGGGGGGGQAAQGAQGPAQAMASQAASAAGSAASSGVAAAGAVAGAAVGAAAAGGLVASAASAVGMGAAVATVAGVAALVTSNLGGNNTVVVSEATTVVSLCGLVNPTVRSAQVSFWMEGFTQEFNERESVLLESLLIESYNNITVGDGCSDKFLRELNGAKLIDQVVFPANDVNNSFVETTFETILFCDDCPEESPMFASFADSEVFRRNLRQISSNRRLETLESFQFFQQFIQEVMVGVKRLSDDEEISDGFIQMLKGYITESIEDQDDGSSGGESGGGTSGGGVGGGNGQSLVTDINASFNQAGEIAAITFEFTVDGEKIVTKVDVAPATDAPTFTPTLFPTDQPSLVPTMSQRPSVTNATYSPTDSPSSEPSEGPSTIPSFQPSSIPSVVPSEFPSLVPSIIPSIIPSEVPSAAPSDAPSDSPSSNPSSVPSDAPSARPSARPSATPSLFPSIAPSVSVQPSDVPSHVPSFQPSAYPTRSPSSRPTNYPTVSSRPTPCIWTATEKKESKSGNGPNANCTGIDYLSQGVPVHIIDQSQDGESVTFRLHPRLFKSNISSLAAMTYDTSAPTTVCDVQNDTTFDHTRSFLGDCTGGELEVTFYLFMCKSENNVNQTNSTFCETPSSMNNYYEYRYKLDCWEKCETEGPTSGPTSGPTVSMRPSNIPSAKPTSLPSVSPTNRPTISKQPSAPPTTTAPV